MFWQEAIVYAIEAIVFFLVLVYFLWVIWKVTVLREEERSQRDVAKCRHEWEIIWLDDEGGALSTCRKCGQEEFN